MGTAYVRTTATWTLLREDYSGVGIAYVRTTAAWVLLRADYSGVGTATCGLQRRGYC
jgi:hypothetical protein